MTDKKPDKTSSSQQKDKDDKKLSDDKSETEKGQEKLAEYTEQMTKPSAFQNVESSKTCPYSKKNQKILNLAIQGGGAHGAFAWGVIDRLLEEENIHIEGISGTSAGSMNAAVLAYGLLVGGHQGAREKLHNFWWDISQSGALYNPCKQLPWEKFWYGESNMNQCVNYRLFETLTRWFSPYQLNPFDFNPLKDVLLKNVDFDHLQTCQATKLFLSCTNVRTGQVRVFRTDEITSDVVLASACLPFIFKAVEIEGEYYWDGGYTGNPSLFPFFYHVDCPDILIIHINPIERPAPPTLPADIFNRINEISFNSALLKEFRSIAFVHKLIDEKWLKDEYMHKLKYVLMHAISADTALHDLSVASKLSSNWNFLLMLRNRGRAKTSEWLARNFNKINVESTLNLRYELTSSGRKPSAYRPKPEEEK